MTVIKLSSSEFIIKLSYQDLVEAVYKYHFETRFDVITYCMGFYGEITQETYDMVQKLYHNKHIEA